MYRVARAAALAALLFVPAAADANGRFPATVNVHDRPGNDQLILLPATFGLLISTNDGGQFHWICEDAVGYGGTFDPDYAIATDGTIYATTFDGLKISRDGGCTFVIAPDLDEQWVGDVEIGPSGIVWAATSSGGMPNNVYQSTDNGVTFTAANLFDETAWWKSLKVAPGDPDRIYVTGYLVAATPEAILKRSDDGGETWIDLPVTDFGFGNQPLLFVEGVSPTNPDIVFARVNGSIAPAGDALYRSTDAGQSWTQVLELSDTIGAFLIRSDGATVIAASAGKCPGEPKESLDGCVKLSTDGGATFHAAATQPKMACIMERSDGTLFACGANWEPDRFALGRSTDAAAWTAVFRFSEMAGPLSCEPGTVQFDICESLQWPSIAEQFGVGSAPDAGSIDASGGGGGKGCGCSMAFAAAFLVVPRRRRRP